MIEGEDVRKIALSLAVLNLIELGFALLETEFGLPLFYPLSPVTQLIYRSTDVVVAGVGQFRIPATFVQAAAYGGNMVLSMPLLVGAIVHERRASWQRRLFFVAIGAAAIGVFLSASRSSAAFLFVLAMAATLSGRIKNFPWAGWLALFGLMGWLVATTPRMQRFFTLGDTTYVKQRVEGSVNTSFLELLVEYPMGNGLGGGGTSVPYFLQSRIEKSVGLENEYSRIMLEQGAPGLALWVGFILWILTRPIPHPSERWYLGQWLARIAIMFEFMVGLTGLGLLTSIPATATLMLFVGWTAVPALVPGSRFDVRKRVRQQHRAIALESA
jgi:hypothetical protein